MKKGTLIIALLVGISVNTSYADPLVYEGFEDYYATGDNTSYNVLNDGGAKYIKLKGNANGGVGWAGAWNDRVPVMEKTMSKTGVKSSANGYWRGGDNRQRTIATAAGSNMAKAGLVKSNGKIGAVGKTLYISFLWSFQSGNSWGGFSLFNGGGSEVMYFGKGGGNWRFDQSGFNDPSRTTFTGSRAHNTDNDNPSFQTNPDLVVIKLEFKSDKTEATAWINPDTKLSNLTGNGNIKTASANAIEFDRIRLASGGGHNNVDEIRMATNFKSVLGVPEPATFSLLALGGIAFLARRHRRIA